MRKFWILILPIFLFSCVKEEESTKHFLGVVNIVSFSMPDTAYLLQPFTISATAVAPNSCWSNIFFNLNVLQDDNQYSLAAYGYYTPTSGCAPIAVSLDTTYSITFGKKGMYYFFYAKDINTIVEDSILVMNQVK